MSTELNKLTRGDLVSEVLRLRKETERLSAIEDDGYLRLAHEAHGYREALQTILANTEEDAIKHRDYEHLAKDIADTARAVLQAFGAKPNNSGRGHP